MKKYLFMCLAAVCCMAFTACGDDDDEKFGNGNNTYGVKTEVKETNNNITLTATTTAAGLTETTVYSFDFENDKCSKATISVTYPTEALAKAAYDALSASEKANARRSGKTVTIDVTEEYKDMDKEDVKKQVNILKQSLEGSKPDNPTRTCSAKIQDNGNTVTMTGTAIEDGLWRDFVATFTFVNNLCVKAVSSMTFDTEAYAQQYYRECLAEEEKEQTGCVYSISGRIVNSDDTPDWKDETKEEVLEELQDVAAWINAGCPADN